MAPKRKTKQRLKKDTRQQQESLVESDDDRYQRMIRNDDEIDEFYAKKDRILLNGRSSSSAAGPEHVYASSGSSVSDSDEEESENELLNEDAANDMLARFVKKRELDSDIEDKDDDMPDPKAWGQRRQNFYDNDYKISDTGDVISEKEAEAAQMEEEDALSIQKRLLDEIDEDAFGLDDIQKPTDETKVDKVEPTNLSKLPKKKLQQLIAKEAPELESFFEECRKALLELETELSKILELVALKQLPDNTPGLDYVRLRHNLLVGYVSNLCFYLSMKAQRKSTRNHPIVKRLGQYKKLIEEQNQTRDQMMPQIEKILAEINSGRTLRKIGEAQSADDDDDELASDPEDEQQMESDEALYSNDDDMNVHEQPQISSKMSLQSALGEIRSIYDDLTLQKTTTDDQLEENGGSDDEAIDETAVFGDTDSENDEPVFTGMKEKDSEEDDHDESQSRTERGDEELEEGADRRSINYQISKNKGLTPKRKKEYRNPRVKHRIKFRQANIRRKGQVRAMRNEGSDYRGEMSGINKMVVKSVKLK